MNKRFLVAALSLPMLFGLNVSAAEQTLEERIERLERITDNPVLMQLSRRLGEQQREIQSLYDEIDRLKFELDQAKAKLDKQYTETDERLSRLEAAPKVADELVEAGESEVTTTEQTTVVAPVQVKESVNVETESSAIPVKPASEAEKQLYNDAFSLMKAGKYAAAQKAFANFRKEHPQSQLASNASYWEGEAWMVLSQPKQALTAFEDVFNAYPDSYKAPDSMLRAADTYKALGEDSKAKALYEEVAKRFPASKASAKAQSKLETMK